MKRSVRQMIESNPNIFGPSPVYSDNFVLRRNGQLDIYKDLTEEDCDLILKAPHIFRLRFTGSKVNDATFKILNDKILPGRPNLQLDVTINGYGTYNDLDFLAHLGDLKHLTVDLFGNDEIAKINRYLELDTLGIGTYKISIKDIIHQKKLKQLFVFEKPKDINVVGQMTSLEKITFSKQTLLNLDFLIPLSNLKELNFILGGTKNLAALPDIGEIERLSFVLVRQLSIDNLLPINDMKYLKNLSFDTQPHLTDLHWLTNKEVKTDVKHCKNYKP